MIHASLCFRVIVRWRDAFRLAMTDAGLQIPDEYMVLRDWYTEAARIAITEMMELPKTKTIASL